MVRIIRDKRNTYCVEDFIYLNDKLIGTQGNLLSQNRFGAKNYKYGNQTFKNVSWERLKN